jgi:hypothetical protein
MLDDAGNTCPQQMSVTITAYWKHQRRQPFGIWQLLQALLTFSCILLLSVATVCSGENVVPNGECESNNHINNNGHTNDSGQCLAAAVHSNSDDEARVEKEEAVTQIDADTATTGTIPWYRNLTDDCKDNHRECDVWAEENECTIDPERMLQLCPKACQLCDNENDSGTYISNCYGEDQHVSRKDTALRVREVEEYMLQQVFVEEKYA